MMSLSRESSPRSSALPSPPDSPSLDSVSSFPSVGSSFFFSSAGASPGARQEQDQSLIIPSLTLPSRIRIPTVFGQTLGELRIIVVGDQAADLLVEDNDDIVEVGTWEEGDYGTRVLRASTDWIELQDRHGLERYEPTRNVEIVELPYDVPIPIVESMVHTPFHDLLQLLHPNRQPSALLSTLLSSHATPLYAALVYLPPPRVSNSQPSPIDPRLLLISSLSTHIPVVAFPRTTRNLDPSIKLASWKPNSAIALRNGLFHSPETIATLRAEAADRFLRWREAEGSVNYIQQIMLTRFREAAKDEGDDNSQGISLEPVPRRWDKAKWEIEWMERHSHDVAKRMREGTITQRSIHKHTSAVLTSSSTSGSENAGSLLFQTCSGVNIHAYDPLHLPSLFLFSVSLLRPLRLRLFKSFQSLFDALSGICFPRNAANSTTAVYFAVLGGFCVGVGVGLYVK